MRSIVSTKQFTYDKANKQFLTEASDINLRFKQIYPDSCDEGLELMSARTDEVSEWVVIRTNHNNDREFVSWTLQPTAKSLKQFPGLKDHTMIIFND